MASEFNYKRAWRELAGPYYENVIPEEARALVEWIGTKGRDLVQKPDLDVPIPEELIPRFESISSVDLAVSACTINAWGHWAYCDEATIYYPKLEPKRVSTDLFVGRAVKDYIAEMNFYGPPDGEVRVEYHRNGPPDSWAGAHWKFSNMADQLLHKRCGLPARTRHGEKSGYSIAVHEGKLRVQYSSSSRWTWEEICWAAPQFYERLKAHPMAKNYCKFEELTAEFASWQPHSDWFTKDFTDHKEGSSWDNAELAKRYQPLVADVFFVRDVGAANFKPHPFMIGSKHFGGDSMYLDPDRAPCAVRNCRLKYSEHTHDVVMFLECKKTLANKEAADALFKLKTAFEQDKVRVDGFVFLESKAGYVIQPPEAQGVAEVCSESDIGKSL